jgi:lipoprotein-anchoring transpeptidase ErfK/SrfK
MNSSSSDGRSCLKPALLLVGLLACIGLVAFSLFTSPASAAFFVAPTPTQENLWGYMALPKPTQTAVAIQPPTEIPTFTPEPTAVPAATETPGQMTMEIVENPGPANSSQQPAPAVSYGGSKYILVDISEQHMYAYDGDTLVYSFVASTGMNNATRVGTFAVQSKIPNAYGSTWDIWMPNWLGIYWSGGLENGIHALPILPNGATLWAGLLGRPISYGCVVLGTYESRLLYDWAEIGTPVEIQW